MGECKAAGAGDDREVRCCGQLEPGWAVTGKKVGDTGGWGIDGLSRFLADNLEVGDADFSATVGCSGSVSLFA